MNIGIMSMQRVINYGSFLQAYGLKKTLEKMGHTVQFVDYEIEPPLEDEEGKNQEKTSVIKRVLNLLSPSYRAYRREQIKMNRSFEVFMNTFRLNYFPKLGLTEKYNICPRLDLLIIGSDEVFNCTQPGDMVGYSRQLFGKDNRANKLVSYAASFGYTTIERLKRFHIDLEIGDYLSRFDALSVRDKNTQSIVEQLTGIKSLQHIDPVLLYPFEEANDIDIKINNYIVVYAYAGRISDEEARAIRKFADEQNKRIVTLGYYQPFCDEYILASPIEVLAYIRNADFVITDTFHGVVFSIKYQKRFGVIIRESNRNKISDLLDLFDLQGRKIERLEMLSYIVSAEINIGNVQKQIEGERVKAMEYLLNCIK